MTLLYFCLSGLDILNQLDNYVLDHEKKLIIDWVYEQQIVPSTDDDHIENAGFRGGPFLNPKPLENGHVHPHNFGHLAMTYTALAILTILGDDFGRVNKKLLVRGMRKLQQNNGCFQAAAGGSETDIRFVYCACAIAFFLDDWSGIDVDKAEQYILSSRGYDFAFAHGPGQESHSGSTYCAIGALALMGRLHKLSHRTELIEWLLRRQISGFNGRPQKDADTCYSFWVGASLKMLNDSLQYADAYAIFSFVNMCQNVKVGGVSKVPGVYPDVLHSYLGLAGLALLEKFDDHVLRRLYAPLNISMRAAKHLNRELPEMLEEEQI